MARVTAARLYMCHQFLKVSSHSLTNFAVYRDHVSTITVCTPVSLPFRDRSKPFRFHRILGIAKIHHQESIHRWQSGRIFHLLPPLHQSFWECVHCSSCVQVHLHTIQTASDFSQVKMSLRNGHTCLPNFRAIQPNSIPFIITPAIIPFIMTPAIMKPKIVSGPRLCRFYERGVVDQRVRRLIRGSAQENSVRTDPHRR